MLLAVCVVLMAGWYMTANSGRIEPVLNGDATSESSISEDELREKVQAYDDALYEANERIESMNSCVDDSFGLFDSGEFDDGLSSLDDCRASTVDMPS